SSLTIATKPRFTFSNNPKPRKKPPPRNERWKFVPLSRSETTDEYLRRSQIAATRFPMTEATTTTMPAAAAPRYTRANPFPGRSLVNRRLSGTESEKDTRHFEIDLTGWGLSFEAGDSLAVYPTNDPELVDEIIHSLGATGDEQVPRQKGEPTKLREALLRDYSVKQP